MLNGPAAPDVSKVVVPDPDMRSPSQMDVALRSKPMLFSMSAVGRGATLTPAQGTGRAKRRLGPGGDGHGLSQQPLGVATLRCQRPCLDGGQAVSVRTGQKCGACPGRRFLKRACCGRR